MMTFQSEHAQARMAVVDEHIRCENRDAGSGSHDSGDTSGAVARASGDWSTGGISAQATMFSWSAASAQSASDVVGTWTLVSSVTEKDGTRTDQFGAGAKGMMTLDAGGHFMLTIIGPDLPKFASNNRTTGTSEENMAVVSKSIAMWRTLRWINGRLDFQDGIYDYYDYYDYSHKTQRRSS